MNVQNVVTYNVVIDVNNPEQKLKPGMTANLTITIDERNNVLKVPNCGASVHADRMLPGQRIGSGHRQGRDRAAVRQGQPSQAAG